MEFFRAAQCFATAVDTLDARNEIGREKAVEAALTECSEGLSSIPRDKLSAPADAWVAELDSFLDPSGLVVAPEQGRISAKAATLTAEDVERVTELTKSLQEWFSAENRKGL